MWRADNRRARLPSLPTSRDTAQVALLVRLMPLIAAEKVFALKGRTAINYRHKAIGRQCEVAGKVCEYSGSAKPHFA
jgi:hypothetical protein